MKVKAAVGVTLLMTYAAAGAVGTSDTGAQRAGASTLEPGQASLVFSAPPRESHDTAMRTYGPIADYLSRAIGKPVVFRHAGNWLTYQTEMQKGAYDLVFDGAHFNGWRAAKLQHRPLAKLPGEHVFVVVTKKSNQRINDLKHLTGARVCAMDPSNLGTLTLLNEFANPARQPVLVNINGWSNIYRAMLAEKCVAAVMPLLNFEKYDGDAQAKILFRSKAVPNQAFSAGPRVSSEDQDRIAQALLSANAEGPTATLRSLYAGEGGLVRANKDEYLGLAVMLRDVWGYFP